MGEGGRIDFPFIYISCVICGVWGEGGNKLLCWVLVFSFNVVMRVSSLTT